MGGGEFHQLREGHQLEIVRGVRRGLQQRQQLAVDAVYRARRGQPHLHRDQVFDARLLPLSRHGPLMQRDVFLALLRVWRCYARTAALGTWKLQAHRPHRCRRGTVHFIQRGTTSVSFFFFKLCTLIRLTFSEMKGGQIDCSVHVAAANQWDHTHTLGKKNKVSVEFEWNECAIVSKFFLFLSSRPNQIFTNTNFGAQFSCGVSRSVWDWECWFVYSIFSTEKKRGSSSVVEEERGSFLAVAAKQKKTKKKMMTRPAGEFCWAAVGSKLFGLCRECGLFFFWSSCLAAASANDSKRKGNLFVEWLWLEMCQQ